MDSSVFDRRAQLCGMVALVLGGGIIDVLYSGLLYQLGELPDPAVQLFSAIFLFVCLVVPGFTVAQCAAKAELLNSIVFGFLSAVGLLALLRYGTQFRELSTVRGTAFYAAIIFTCSIAGGVLSIGLRRSFPDSLKDRLD